MKESSKRKKEIFSERMKESFKKKKESFSERKKNLSKEEIICQKENK